MSKLCRFINYDLVNNIRQEAVESQFALMFKKLNRETLNKEANILLVLILLEM